MADMNYRSNSHKSKAEPKAELEGKRVEKITSGVVKTQKKSEVSKLADVFVSEDIGNVKTYVISDVIIPAVKKLVYDIVTDGVDMILYGESGRNRRGDNRSTSKISYSNFYDQRDRNRFSSDDPRSVSRIDYEDLVFHSRGDAESVRIGMIETIDRYGYVTIADMYDMAGRTAPYTAQKYGWTNVSSASVVRARDGGYKLKLPKACQVD